MLASGPTSLPSEIRGNGQGLITRQVRKRCRRSCGRTTEPVRISVQPLLGVPSRDVFARRPRRTGANARPDRMVRNRRSKRPLGDVHSQMHRARTTTGRPSAVSRQPWAVSRRVGCRGGCLRCYCRVRRTRLYRMRPRLLFPNAGAYVDVGWIGERVTRNDSVFFRTWLFLKLPKIVAGGADGANCRGYCGIF